MGRIKLYIRDHAKPVVVTMAEEAGHTVMWQTPQNYEINPTEMVWANVKGTVGRQYTTTKALADVKSRLKSAFATLDTKSVAVYIKKANNILAEMLYHIMDMEVID